MELNLNANTLQIRFRSLDSIACDSSVIKVINELNRLDLEFIGPVPIPKKIIKSITPNKSLSVQHNKSNGYKDFFGNKARHDRFLLVFNATNIIIDLFKNINLFYFALYWP